MRLHALPHPPSTRPPPLSPASSLSFPSVCCTELPTRRPPTSPMTPPRSPILPLPLLHTAVRSLAHPPPVLYAAAHQAPADEPESSSVFTPLVEYVASLEKKGIGAHGGERGWI
jgi:hypothetical protein